MEELAAEMAAAIRALQQEVVSLKATKKTAKAAEEEDMNDQEDEAEVAIPDWEEVLKTEAVMASTPHGVALVQLLGHPPLEKLKATGKTLTKYQGIPQTPTTTQAQAGQQPGHHAEQVGDGNAGVGAQSRNK